MNRLQEARNAEIYVAKHLADSGWTILAHDLRTPYAQVDILARSPLGDLVLVEVKARHRLSWARDGDAISHQQLLRLQRALSWILQSQHGIGRMELAVVTIPLTPKSAINWFPLE